MKKLGFGLMRLPLIDPEDASSVDVERFTRMADVLLKMALPILIRHTSIIWGTARPR
jgi:hypothetical protein